MFKTKTCKALVHTIQKISPKYLWIYWWITFFIHSFSRLGKGHYIKRKHEQEINLFCFYNKHTSTQKEPYSGMQIVNAFLVLFVENISVQYNNERRLLFRRKHNE